jgi:V/A-type H+-transporting ATPase subunit E
MKEGAERIRQRILTDARAKAEEIRKEAAAAADKVLAEAAKQAAAKKEEILIQARKEAGEHKRRILGMSMLEARKEMLAAKQNFIEEAFQKAVSKLSDSDTQTYFDILLKMLLASIETGEETVILSERDAGRVPKGFWDDLNLKLKAAGKKGSVSLTAETRDIPGGFILRSAGVEINNSFLSLLSIQRDELEPLVAGVLFGEK